MGRKAFNLIEVAIALGISSFAIVAILGLMSVSMSSGKASQRDTVIALAAKYVVSDLTRQIYPPIATNYYFDYAGNATNAPAYYHCSVSVTNNPIPFSSPASNTNATGVRLTFTWEGQTNTTGSNAKIFWTALSAY